MPSFFRFRKLRYHLNQLKLLMQECRLSDRLDMSRVRWLLRVTAELDAARSFTFHHQVRPHLCTAQGLLQLLEQPHTEEERNLYLVQLQVELLGLYEASRQMIEEINGAYRRSVRRVALLLLLVTGLLVVLVGKTMAQRADYHLVAARVDTSYEHLLYWKSYRQLAFITVRKDYVTAVSADQEPVSYRIYRRRWNNRTGELVLFMDDEETVWVYSERFSTLTVITSESECLVTFGGVKFR